MNIGGCVSVQRGLGCVTKAYLIVLRPHYAFFPPFLPTQIHTSSARTQHSKSVSPPIKIYSNPTFHVKTLQ